LPPVALFAAGADLGQHDATGDQLGGDLRCSPASSLVTLFITKWAVVQDASSAADFYTAGGGITGFQNGLAIAGDYMSAASFLGISGLVFGSGFDGLIFSIGWLVGWPVTHLPDGRTPAQPRQVHLCRRRLLPFCANADAQLRGHRLAGCRGVLHDRPDGRCRAVDQSAVRSWNTSTRWSSSVC
jgi:hypothetical protein